MRCPSCSASIEDAAAECPFCGVVVAKWKGAAERPPVRRTAPGAARIPSQPRGRRPGVSPLRIALLSTLGAAVLVGGYWAVKVRPRIRRIEDPYYGSDPSKKKDLAVEDAQGEFDRRVRLPLQPQGATARGRQLLLANRESPWGLSRLTPQDDGTFAIEKIPIIEREYGQKIQLSAITWNGSNLIGYTTGSWFGRRQGDVFTIHDPGDYRVLEVRDAPPLLGCVAWDGTGYWAATRKNTTDSAEEAYLYRLDANFAVTARYPPPSPGCQGMAWDGEQLWIADVFDDDVMVLDVRSGEPRVVHRQHTPLDYLSGLAWDGKRMWVTEYDDKGLWRISEPKRLAWKGGLSEPTVAMMSAAEPAAPVAATGDEVARLRQQLRSDSWGEAMRAEMRLRELGLPIDFDRHLDTSPDLGEEEMEVIDWSAEARDGAVYASWVIHFGPALFEDNQPSADPSIISIPIFRRYTISIEGGTLPAEIEKVYEAQPGENRRSGELLASGLGPGKYRIGCFLHTQYIKRDGTSMILNESSFTLEVEL